MAASTSNSAAATSNLPWDTEPEFQALSPEYFQALSSCTAEEAEPLLLSPEFSDANFVSRVTPAQALDYLSAVVSLSPPALQPPNSMPTSASASASASSSSLLFQANDKNASLPKATSTATKNSVALFLNIRNSVAILASSPTTRHQISTCGIIPKLNIPNNPHAHVEFLQCCVLASQYRYALRHFNTYGTTSQSEGVSVPNFQITTDGSNTKNTELFLRYHYLRGIIFYASNETQSAISEWGHCLSAPSMSVNQIAVDAWKKMVLAKCVACRYDDEEELVIGDSTVSELVDYVVEMPKGTSSVVKRFFNVSSNSNGPSSSRETEDSSMRNALEKYHHLIESFFRNNFQILDVLDDDQETTSSSAANEGSINVFHEDGNIGMIKQLVPAMRWRKLRSISKIYSAIPLAKLSSKLKLSQQDCVQFLIHVTLRQEKEGESKFRSFIEFTIDDEAGVVYFDEERNETSLQLEGKIEKCMALAKRVKDLDVAMTSSAKYQANVLKGIGEKDGNLSKDRRSVIVID